jgi:hypothetical protein
VPVNYDIFSCSKSLASNITGKLEMGKVHKVLNVLKPSANLWDNFSYSLK